MSEQEPVEPDDAGALIVCFRLSSPYCVLFDHKMPCSECFETVGVSSGTWDMLKRIPGEHKPVCSVCFLKNHREEIKSVIPMSKKQGREVLEYFNRLDASKNKEGQA